MNDDVPIIHKRPASFGLALQADGIDSLPAQFFFDVGGDRLHLTVRISAANNEVIRERREIFHFEDDRIEGLVVQGGSSAKESFLFRTFENQPLSSESFER